MSKEQKTLKSCYILDRLREWFELYGNQNHQRAKEELNLAIDELYEYQQKDRQLADLEAKLAKSEKERELDNSFWKQECDSLQKTLAEKEKEILDIKFMMRNTEQALRNVPNAMAGQRKRIDELTKELKQDNQDKISFAIAELEKVKDWCENHKFSDEDDYVIAYEPDEEDASGCVDYLKDQIDNQITSLKKGVE